MDPSTTKEPSDNESLMNRPKDPTLGERKVIRRNGGVPLCMQQVSQHTLALALRPWVKVRLAVYAKGGDERRRSPIVQKTVIDFGCEYLG